MDRHGDSAWHLHRAIVRDDDDFDRKTIVTWRERSRAPRTARSLEVLARIEHRYRLPVGYFKAKFAHKARATAGHRAANISPAEQRRLAWHLPDDFGDLSLEKQEEILAWVRMTIISGSTDYSRPWRCVRAIRCGFETSGLAVAKQLIYWLEFRLEEFVPSTLTHAVSGLLRYSRFNDRRAALRASGSTPGCWTAGASR